MVKISYTERNVKMPFRLVKPNDFGNILLYIQESLLFPSQGRKGIGRITVATLQSTEMPTSTNGGGQHTITLARVG